MLPGYGWMNLLTNYMPVTRLAEGKTLFSHPMPPDDPYVIIGVRRLQGD
jgi:hypothetical protein